MEQPTRSDWHRDRFQLQDGSLQTTAAGRRTESSLRGGHSALHDQTPSNEHRPLGSVHQRHRAPPPFTAGRSRDTYYKGNCHGRTRPARDHRQSSFRARRLAVCFRKKGDTHGAHRGAGKNLAGGTGLRRVLREIGGLDYGTAAVLGRLAALAPKGRPVPDRVPGSGWPHERPDPGLTSQIPVHDRHPAHPTASSNTGVQPGSPGKGLRLLAAAEGPPRLSFPVLNAGERLSGKVAWVGSSANMNNRPVLRTTVGRGQTIRQWWGGLPLGRPKLGSGGPRPLPGVYLLEGQSAPGREGRPMGIGERGVPRVWRRRCAGGANLWSAGELRGHGSSREPRKGGRVFGTGHSLKTGTVRPPRCELNYTTAACCTGSADPSTPNRGGRGTVNRPGGAGARSGVRPTWRRRPEREGLGPWPNLGPHLQDISGGPGHAPPDPSARAARKTAKTWPPRSVPWTWSIADGYQACLSWDRGDGRPAQRFPVRSSRSIGALWRRHHPHPGTLSRGAFAVRQYV